MSRQAFPQNEEREKHSKLKLLAFSIVFGFLFFQFASFLYEEFSFHYEVSCGTWVKPCGEYVTRSLEVNKVMTLLEIRTMLSILALIAWIGVSKYVGLV
ncbi:MAG: hypothetical protein QXU09_02670 [Thermoproteota archaeon]